MNKEHQRLNNPLDRCIRHHAVSRAAQPPLSTYSILAATPHHEVGCADMPALNNLRHERFARAFIKTNVAARAYLKAGYTANTRNALDASSSRLLGRAKVQSRIKELKQQMADRHRITVDSLL